MTEKRDIIKTINEHMLVYVTSTTESVVARMNEFEIKYGSSRMEFEPFS